jgi:hypothetical protein
LPATPEVALSEMVGVYVEPLVSDGGGTDVRVSVIPTTGSTESLGGMTLLLKPTSRGAVTRYGKLTRRGQLVFSDIDPSAYRLHSIGEAQADAAAAGRRRPAGHRFHLTAAAAARGVTDALDVRVEEMASADGGIQASVILDPAGRRLDLQVRAVEAADSLVSTTVELPSGELLRLLVPLSPDPALDMLRGDVRLGVPGEITMGNLETVHVEALRTTWVPVIRGSISRASFDRDRQAWLRLARTPGVSAGVADAIMSALDQL